MRIMNDPMVVATTVALGLTSAAIKLDHIALIDITAKLTGANQANKAISAVDAALDNVTAAGHGYTTGAKVTLTTTGALPGGLAVLTDYYVVVVDANKIGFATSQANALAGTLINLTDAGSGTNTIVVTAALAGTVKLQKSNDPDDVPDANKTWLDVAAATAFSAAGTINFTAADVGYRLARLVATVTSGTVVLEARINGKGA